jgi:hypothetical protein
VNDAGEEDVAAFHNYLKARRVEADDEEEEEEEEAAGRSRHWAARRRARVAAAGSGGARHVAAAARGGRAPVHRALLRLTYNDPERKNWVILVQVRCLVLEGHRALLSHQGHLLLLQVGCAIDRA